MIQTFIVLESLIILRRVEVKAIEIHIISLMYNT